jgi:hypothetical protein
MKQQALIDVLTDLNIKINEKQNNNAGFVSIVLAKFLREHPEFNFVDVENELRNLNSRVYLLAFVLSAFPPFEGKELTSYYPTRLGVHLPFALWICMNGETEAIETMKGQNLPTTYNLLRLFNCGFLTIKE